MAQRKKLRLKKKYRRLLLYITVLVIGIFGFSIIYENKTYNDSAEGQLIAKGYESSTVTLIENKMQESDIEYLLNEDKIDYVKDLLEDKYFIKENFQKYIEYYEQNSKKSFHDVIAIINVGSDKSWYEVVNTTNTSDKYLVLVNKFNSLPENYEAGVIKRFTSTYALGDVSAEETCYNAFIEMTKAAKEEGITIVATSGYRTYETQKNIFDEMASSKGEQYALEHAAKPGTSEHETGLSLDIFSFGSVMETFKTTPAYAWLHENAYKFGFIERYEEGKEFLTGYKPESWHYRYVGVDTAIKLKEEGITFDEYHAFYLAK